MKAFKLELDQSLVVTGAHSIPLARSSSVKKPLIVGLHGGGYDHRYFDALPDYSAKSISDALSIPFITIDRPSYGGTSSVLPIPNNSDFTWESAKMIHQSILPRLWQEFALPNQCTCLVLLAHSLGAMPAIAVAALHSGESQEYPLGGLIVSGMGDELRPNDGANRFVPIDDDHISMPPTLKDAVMFKSKTCSPEMLQQTVRLTAPMPIAEAVEFPQTWIPHWKERYARMVRVPTLYMLVDDDPFFFTDRIIIRRCVDAFKNSIRAEGSLMSDAPHCVELSHWSLGWYTRSFGFALECAASFEMLTSVNA